MNICFFTNQHVSKLRGGIERATHELANILKQNGHHIFLLSVHNPLEDDFIKENQYILHEKVQIYSSKNQEFLSLFAKNNNIEVIINQSEVIDILRLIKKSIPSTPVVSVIHTDPAAAIKSVQDNWDYWKLQYGPTKFLLLSPLLFLRKLYQIYTRKKYTKAKHLYYYSQSSAVVLLSDKFFESFKNLSGITDASKLFAISNPDIVSTQQNVATEKENIVLFVGRLVFQKRLDRLFKIWNRIKDKKDWKLIIVGDGPDRSLYEKLCKDWNTENVEFTGHCDPIQLYQKAKILCITSSHEGYGLTITEGLQHDIIPIVFNSYESVTDIIENNYNGFLIEPFSLEKYSVTLEKLISDTEYQESIRRSIHSNNIKRALDSGIIVKKWEHLFHKLHKH